MKRLMDWKDVLIEEKMMVLQYVIPDNLWIMKHEGKLSRMTQLHLKNKVERIAPWNARWRILELLKTKHVLSIMFI